MINKPYTPRDLVEALKKSIHPDVVEVVNSTLLKKATLNSARVVVPQEDVVQGLMTRGWPREDIFSKGALDFEWAYREQGWSVTYAKRGYNESGDSHWVFEVKV